MACVVHGRGTMGWSEDVSVTDATAALRARHEAVYSLRGMPPFEVCRLSPRLSTGCAPLTELDVLELLDAGVTHLLDLRERHEWAAPGRLGKAAVHALPLAGIVRSELPMPDAEAPAIELLWRAHDWFRLALAQPGSRLFVHCRAGIERTGTVLLAWTAWYERLSLEAALAELRRRAPRLRPLPHQIDAVAHWLAKAKAPRGQHTDFR
jgi:atypical dual specificity phosphatase